MDRLQLPLFDAKPPRDQRDRREEAAATIIAFIIHAVVIILLIGVGGKAVFDVATELGVGDGIGAGLAGGGGGGGEDNPVAIAAVEDVPAAPEVAEKPPEPVVIEPVPVPLPEIKPIEPPIALAPIDTLPKAFVTPVTGAGGGQGTGTGAGTGSGTGPGSGGGSGGGEGGGIGSGIGPGSGRGRMLAPSPEVLLIPPPAPGSVRGKTVVVQLAVDETGAVKSAEIVPSTGDRKYDNALRKVALGWRFRPARDEANKPVAVLFPVTFTF